MKCFRILLLIALIINEVFAQKSFLGHQICFTPKNRPAVSFNEEEYKSALIQRYTNRIKSESEREEFISLLIHGKRHYLSSNIEYDCLDEEAEYIRKICSKIYNDSLNKLRIRIVRDPSLNACAFEDGTIYINIGLLARYNNEAELAATLGHEIGHVFYSHTYDSYKARKSFYRSVYLNGYSSGISFVSNTIKSHVTSHKLMSHEIESDDFAIDLLKKSNYSTKALSTEHQIFLSLQRKYRDRKDFKKEYSLFYLQTHPTTEYRIEKARKVENNNGSLFLVDSLYFKKLKSKAIDETINLYFEELEFDECLEMAFKEHLKNPKDPFYLFYITECTRRIIELNPETSNKSFITGIYNYYPYTGKSPKKKYVIYSEDKFILRSRDEINPILLRLNGVILQMDTSELKLINKSKLLNSDTLWFYTYKDALSYFKSTNTVNSFNLNNLFLKDTLLSTFTDKEMEFLNLKNSVEEYHTTTPVRKNKRVLFLLYDVQHVVSSSGVFRGTDFNLIHTTSDSVYLKLDNYSDLKKSIISTAEIDFNDKSKFYSYLNLLYPLIKKTKEKKSNLIYLLKLIGGKDPAETLITRDSASVNYDKALPELISVMNKYDIDGIVFSGIFINKETQYNPLGGFSIEKWKVRNYYIDTRNRKVKFMLSPLCVKYESIGNTASYMGPPIDLYKCFYESIINVITK